MRATSARTSSITLAYGPLQIKSRSAPLTKAQIFELISAVTSISVALPSTFSSQFGFPPDLTGLTGAQRTASASNHVTFKASAFQ